jgi:hypothetical protein
MKKIFEDFIVDDKREYKFKLGNLVASALTGFIVGVISASIFWYLTLKGLCF